MGRQHTRIIVEPFGNFWANVPSKVKVSVSGTAGKRGLGAIRLGTVRIVTDHMGTPVRVITGSGSGGPLASVDRAKL
jgi:hypothetical protein